MNVLLPSSSRHPFQSSRASLRACLCAILSTLSILCLSLSVNSIIASKAEAQEVGLQLYSLRHQLEKDVPSTLKRLQEWGITSVENVDSTWGLSADEFRHQLQQHNIKVVSVGTSYEEMRDNPMAVVYKARFYGADYATFFYIPYIDSISFKFKDAVTSTEAMNQSGRILQDHGITLQYHMHGYEFTKHENGTLADYMLQNVEHAKFQLDTFWVKHGGGNPAALLEKYPGKFSSLHLKDRRKGTPVSPSGNAPDDTSVALGTGNADIAKVIKEARKQGIRYWFVEDESEEVLTQLPQSLKFVYKKLGRDLPGR